MKNTLSIAFAILFIATMMISCSDKGSTENTMKDQLTIDLRVTNSPDDITIENGGESLMEKIDYKGYIKEFWSNNIEILEKAPVDMREAGIDYIFNGKEYVRNDDMASEIDVPLPDSVKTILEQSEGYIKEFGWSKDPDPLFTEGDNYFYFKTPRFKNEYGDEIAIKLVYSDNPKETIEYEYEELSSDWYLVTQYYGE